MAEPSRFTIHPAYFEEEFMSRIKSALEGDNSSADALPFPNFFLPNFLTTTTSAEVGKNDSSATITTAIINELSQLDWHPKSNDLYSLEQTDDLHNIVSSTTTPSPPSCATANAEMKAPYAPNENNKQSAPTLSAFVEFLHSVVRPWLIRTTGVELNEKIAVTGSRYGPTDNLLPHDDRLEGRAFAFVYYLDEWHEEYGGRLLLYSEDGGGGSGSGDLSVPAKVVKRHTPENNAFLFFRVQHNSWHSVEEVNLSCVESSTEVNKPPKPRSRLSINGWFHADKCPWQIAGVTAANAGKHTDLTARNSRAALRKMKPQKEGIKFNELGDYLNAQYLTRESIAKISELFARKSELCLANFLKADLYQDILEELAANGGRFVPTGPPNKRNCFQLNENELRSEASAPACGQLKKLLQLLRSETMAQLLTRFTGLNLAELPPSTSEEPKETDSVTMSPPSEKKKRLDGGDEGHGELLPLLTSTLPRSNGCCENPPMGGEGEVELVSSLTRFQHGSYSLADDQMAADAKNNGFCLDLLLYFIPPGHQCDRGESAIADGTPDESGGKWDADEWGGFTSYFAKDEEEEILQVVPAPNTAYIVFREPEVLSFTKYVNCRAKSNSFYVAASSYFGVMEEEGGEEEEEECEENYDEEEDELGEDEFVDEEDGVEGEDLDQKSED